MVLVLLCGCASDKGVWLTWLLGLVLVLVGCLATWTSCHRSSSITTTTRHCCC